MSLFDDAPVPPLEELVANSPFSVGLGVGLNEIIVAAGYHPWNYCRIPFRAFGGMYPEHDTEEWLEFVAPYRTMRNMLRY